MVRCWSPILMALLLSSKRCALHARRLRRFPAPATDEEHAQVSFLLQVSPHRQPTAVGEVLICAKASARLLRNALPGGGYDGARGSTSALHFVVLITTRSRSVFSKECNTRASRMLHKRELPHHTSVTISYCLKTHAMEGRSISCRFCQEKCCLREPAM